MAQLLSRGDTAERCGRCVVVTCVGGELHELGARMVGDFFDMAGWDTYFCGADTPHEASRIRWSNALLTCWRSQRR